MVTSHQRSASLCPSVVTLEPWGAMTGQQEVGLERKWASESQQGLLAEPA